MAKLSITRLAAMFRRLATSFEAGLDTVSMWKREVDSAPPRNRRGLQQVLTSVSQGETVARGMFLSEVFPPTSYHMVKVGERSGRLEVVYAQLADHYENLRVLRRTLLLGIAWPAFELLVAVTLPALMMLVIGLLVSKPIDYFGFGLSNMGNVMLYCSVVFGFLGACGLFLFALIRGWFGTLPVKIALRIPLLGNVIQTLALGRMAWSLGMAHEAGMDAIETMDLSLKATQLDYYISGLPQITDAIRAGKEMNVALRATDSYPEEFLDSLSMGEVTGTVSETMSRLSNEYRERSKTQFRLLSVIGALSAIIFVCVLIGGILIYAMLQYTSFLNELSSGSI